ncbi:MAG: TetR/AcrR family transcriptional regulator [Actinomycetota bacterium]|nr:TetR/AcrR family transcriptional regulator [Actinomycetota bacterium]
MGEEARLGRGRPRSPGTHKAILDAAVELVGERGVLGVTMDAIAARAGVGKASVYRRWASKIPLVIEAVQDAAEQQVPVPDSGNLRDDLEAMFRGFVAAVQMPLGRAIARLMLDSRVDEDLARAVKQGLMQQRHGSVRQLIERAVDRGEVRPDIDVDLVLDMGIAVVLHRLVVLGEGLDDTLARDLADLVMNGIGS